MPTPSATKSDFFLGTWNAQSDTFTQALDLNDQVTFTILHGGLEMPQPERTLVKASNLHTPGAFVPLWQYAERHISVTFSIRGASTSAILGSIRALLAIIENPPFCIKLSWPGASQWSYADVIAVSKLTIPSDPQKVLALALTGFTIDFLCATGLRGDRITLQNLVPNAGADAPSGAAVKVFDDPLTTLNAYALQAGAAPTVGSNVMTLLAGARVAFGSPAWGAYNLWRVRWRWATGLTANFYLHYTDANNFLVLAVNGTAMSITHKVAGVNTAVASATIALTNVTFYWFQVTQFPVPVGGQAFISVTLSNDSAGAIGTTISTISGATVASSVALLGRPQLEALGNNLQVGGPFSQVNTVSLFGPGGWTFSPAAGSVMAGAWEQDTTKTYTGGPLISQGALRWDAPPAGTWDASWGVYSGGAPAGTFAVPAATLQTFGGSLWVKSSGLNANAVIQFVGAEYDASGAFLRSATFGQVNGNQATWTQLSGTFGIGASTAYLGFWVRAADTTVAGESANATVWVDNVQVWNQTTTGQAAMPYCELLFPQAPCQPFVSGVLGDLNAPAHLSVGTYLSGWTNGQTLRLALGRRANSGSATKPQMVWPAYENFGYATYTPTLSSASYGGWYMLSNAGVPAQALSPGFRTSDMLGAYHLYCLGYSANAAPSNVSVNAWTTQRDVNFVGGTVYASWFGPSTSPIVSQNTWTLIDAGQVNVPTYAQGALVSATQSFAQAYAYLVDLAGSPQAIRLGWAALIPVDGDLLLATVNNPAGTTNTITNWLFIYADGLVARRGGPQDTPAWMFATSSQLQFTPALAYGGTGGITSTSASINVNPAADPYLTLDPALSGANGAAGVNEFGALLTDNVGTVLPFAAEVRYSPLYLAPR